MSRRENSVLFLAKTPDGHVDKALAFCQQNFTDVVVHLGQWGDPLPAELRQWDGDYIISYLSRWVIPAWLLEKAKVAAINFHPAPPEYPGIGCTNFALYDEAKEYGATCHHMLPRVDTGAIIATKRFPLFSTDTVGSLLSRTYDYQLVLFYEVMSLVVEGKPLPTSGERWTREPYSRKEFNQLGRIRPDMSREEVAKRVRATEFGVWRPVVEVQGFVFELKPEKGRG